MGPDLRSHNPETRNAKPPQKVRGAAYHGTLISGTSIGNEFSSRSEFIPTPNHDQHKAPTTPPQRRHFALAKKQDTITTDSPSRPVNAPTSQRMSKSTHFIIRA